MARVVVITGGTSGIGEATSIYLRDKGFTVYSLARHLKDEPGINYLLCDVSNKESVEKAFFEVERREGKIDDVISNAGMGISGAFEYTSKEDANKILSVNLIGSTNVLSAAIPYLKKSKGHMIQIGSIAGELPIPFQTYYSMTKASVEILAQSLSLELKPFGIRVSCVLPGDTKTGFTANRVKGNNNDTYGNRIARSVEKMEKDETKGASPIKVSKVIYRCLKRKNPPTKVAVGFSYKLIRLLIKILPTRFINWALYQLYGR